MAFNIDTFKSQGLVLGGARSALFTCEVVLPGNLSTVGGTGGAAQKFTYTCRAAELPAMTIGTVEVPYFGRRIKIAGDRTFADWTATIMNDEDWAVRSVFEAWQNNINQLISNVRSASYASEQPPAVQGPAAAATGGVQVGNSYKQTITIKQYSKSGNIIAGYQLIGAYPTDLGAITLDWDNQNQIETFPATFAYDYWVALSPNGLGTGATTGIGVPATDYTASL
jgi:hypothetical protein